MSLRFERPDSYFRKMETKEPLPASGPLISRLVVGRRHLVRNDEIIHFLSTKEARSYLCSILRGETKSERHDILINTTQDNAQCKSLCLKNTSFLLDDGKVDNLLDTELGIIFEDFLRSESQKLTYLLHPNV